MSSIPNFPTKDERNDVTTIVSDEAEVVSRITDTLSKSNDEGNDDENNDDNNNDISRITEESIDADEEGGAIKQDTDQNQVSDLYRENNSLIENNVGIKTVDSNIEEKMDDIEDEDLNPPLFQYSRLYGSIPRGVVVNTPIVGSNNTSREKSSSSSFPFESPCTCSVIGKVLLSPETSTMMSEDTGTTNSILVEPAGGDGSNQIENGSIAGVRTTTTTPPRSSSNTVTGASTDPSSVGMEQTSLWSNEIISILGMGLHDGHVLLMDSQTGVSTLSNVEKPFFRVRDNVNQTPIPIAAVSIDSSGTSFGAIDEGGMCCIWTIKYKIQMRKIVTTIPHVGTATTQPQANTSSSFADSSSARENLTELRTQVKELNKPPAGGGAGNVFSNLFPWQTKQHQQQHPQTQGKSQGSSTETAPDTLAEPGTTTNIDQNAYNINTMTTSITYVPALTIAESKMNRINYPKSFGKPTALALDPAYSQKRETSLLVAFEDGRIVFSKRGWLLQRREDKFIQYTGPTSDKDFRGIEAIVWRGSIVAFADCSGVRLYDTETFKPIAHIDRPTGARPSLYYPSTPVKPSLCFETSNSLLVAWGDCLLQMKIRETFVTTSSSTAKPIIERNNSSNQEEQLPTTEPSSADSAVTARNESKVTQLMKRVVECSMAWALDCVACGVAPFDEHHIIVLGIITPSMEDDYEEETDLGGIDPVQVGHRKNEIELQVISRLNGDVVYSDILPLVSYPPPLEQKSSKKFSRFFNQKQSSTERNVTGSPYFAKENYFLLSSFAVPRMENALELMNEMKAFATDALGNSGNEVLVGSSGLESNNHPYYRLGFKDSHLKWNMQMVSFDNEGNPYSIPNENHQYDAIGFGNHENEDDVDSIDSDEYDFYCRPIPSTPQQTTTKMKSNQHPQPPLIVIVSNADAVVARCRDIDDMIAFTVEQRKKPATALRLGIQYKTIIQRHTIQELVNYYFTSLLRVVPSALLDSNRQTSTRSPNNENPNPRPLSLRRMKIAAEAMPILLGGDSNMWDYWLSEVGRIPGALFVVRNYLPVRDPKLDRTIYNRVLVKMLEQVEQLTQNASLGVASSSSSSSDEEIPTGMDTTSSLENRLAMEAEMHFLDAILAWGTTHVMNEQIKLFEQQKRNIKSDRVGVEFLETMVHRTKKNLDRRFSQSATRYLRFPTTTMGDEEEEERQPSPQGNTNLDENSLRMQSESALYDIDHMIEILSMRLTSCSNNKNNNVPTKINMPILPPETARDTRVALDAMAKLCLMNDRPDDALRYFLEIGVRHPIFSVKELEDRAVAFVNTKNSNTTPAGATRNDEYNDFNNNKSKSNYSYLLGFVEQHHLHQYLLDKNWLLLSGGGGGGSVNTMPPIIAFMSLVGIDLLGDFLLQHCVPPQVQQHQQQENQGQLVSQFIISNNNSRINQSTKKKRGNSSSEERRGTLPIDLVADQLNGNMKFMYWYLHILFTYKPDIYVKFPNTTNPPKSIATLHKKQLDLYIKYTSNNHKNSVEALKGIEPYRVIEHTTPLLSFLKVVLQLGSIGPLDVGNTLQKERRGSSGFSHTFALELAYLIEHYGNNHDEANAKLILELYLHGAQSLMLAVSFAQRTKLYSTTLWQILIEHCLSATTTANVQKQSLLPATNVTTPTQPNIAASSTTTTGTTKEDNANDNVFDGTSFGSLLEAAALCGADLAQLVKQIPTGMQVEGLKVRLVAAVADYRLMVDLHKRATTIAKKDRLALIRELAQRVRRGMLLDTVAVGDVNPQTTTMTNSTSSRSDNNNNNNNSDSNNNSIMMMTNILSPTLRPRKRRDPPMLQFTIPIR